MGRLVEVRSGQRGVALPDGHVYATGDQVVLSDADWALVPGAWVGTVLDDLGAHADPPLERDDDVPIDGPADTPSLRTLGAGGQQAAVGSHAHSGTYDPAGTATAAVAAIPSDGTAGTASLRTLGTGATQAAAGSDSRLSNSRTPSGTAGGSLAGTYPNPTITAGSVTGSEIAAAIKDPAAATAGLRTLGTGAAQAAPGDDVRFATQISCLATDMGWLGWSFDSALVGGGTAPTTGVVQLVKVALRTAASVGKVVVYVQALGTSLTSGQNLLGLYDMTGALIDLSADQTSAWGSTGLKATVLVGGSHPLAVGWYYVAILSNGSASPAFGRSGNLNGTLYNGTLAAAEKRFGTNGTAQTTLPAPIVLANTASGGVSYWAALAA